MLKKAIFNTLQLDAARDGQELDIRAEPDNEGEYRCDSGWENSLGKVARGALSCFNAEHAGWEDPHMAGFTRSRFTIRAASPLEAADLLWAELSDNFTLRQLRLEYAIGTVDLFINYNGDPRDRQLELGSSDDHTFATDDPRTQAYIAAIAESRLGTGVLVGDHLRLEMSAQSQLNPSQALQHFVDLYPTDHSYS